MRSLVMRLVVPLALPFALLSFTCACATLGDKDGDGIKRRDDKCPEAAEDKDGIDDYDGCPEDDDGNITAEQKQETIQPPQEPRSFGRGDRDGDGITDDDDACPDDPEDRDGFQDEDGCPDPDNDQDGISDAEDKCPNDPEDKDGFEDEDGCPDSDNDGDGVPDAADACPMETGTDNGCP